MEIEDSVTGRLCYGGYQESNRSIGEAECCRQDRHRVPGKGTISDIKPNMQEMCSFTDLTSGCWICNLPFCQLAS